MGDRRCNSSRQRPRWCYRAGSRCKPCWLLGRPRYGLASYRSVSAAQPKATWGVSSTWPRTQPRQRKAGLPEQREHVVVERKLFRTRLTGPHPLADICDSLGSLFSSCSCSIVLLILYRNGESKFPKNRKKEAKFPNILH